MLHKWMTRLSEEDEREELNEERKMKLGRNQQARVNLRCTHSS